MWVVLFEHRFRSLFNFKYFINIIFHLFMRFVRPMSDKLFRLVYNSFNLCVFFSLSAKILTSESWCLLTWNKQSIIFLRSSWCFNAFDIDTFDKCWKRLKFCWANHTNSFRWARFTHTQREPHDKPSSDTLKNLNINDEQSFWHFICHLEIISLINKDVMSPLTVFQCYPHAKHGDINIIVKVSAEISNRDEVTKCQNIWCS